MLSDTKVKQRTCVLSHSLFTQKVKRPGNLTCSRVPLALHILNPKGFQVNLAFSSGIHFGATVPRTVDTMFDMGLTLSLQFDDDPSNFIVLIISLKNIVYFSSCV